jgi:hypothetical protein
MPAGGVTLDAIGFHLGTKSPEPRFRMMRLLNNIAPHKKQAVNSQHLLFLSRGRDIYH